LPHLQCDTQPAQAPQKLSTEQPPSAGLLVLQPEHAQVTASKDATANTLDAPRVMVLIVLGWQSMLHATKHRTTSCSVRRADLCQLRILESRRSVQAAISVWRTSKQLRVAIRLDGSMTPTDEACILPAP
jgi:hypothetical protein